MPIYVNEDSAINCQLLRTVIKMFPSIILWMTFLACKQFQSTASHY